jgi:hypothetical protein
LTGIPLEQAEQICMKFYQYRNIYYVDGDAEYDQKFLAMFDLNLRMLKEIHIEIEQLAVAEQEGNQSAKEKKDQLIPERQRMLWSLFIPLCIKEEYDLIEMIQQSLYEMRIKLLEDYLARLSAATPDYQLQR